MAVRFFRDGKMISEVTCLQGLNLLGHAQMEDLETGSECGGHGRCGKDRVHVGEKHRQYLNAPTFYENKLLTVKMIEEGWRLACQAFPNENDLELDVTLQSLNSQGSTLKIP
jgi:ferredoxin